MEISEKLSELLEKAESEDIFDKAVVGYLLPDGSSHTVTLNTPEDTVFDIASLTKVCLPHLDTCTLVHSRRQALH